MYKSSAFLVGLRNRKLEDNFNPSTETDIETTIPDLLVVTTEDRDIIIDQSGKPSAPVTSVGGHAVHGCGIGIGEQSCRGG